MSIRLFSCFRTNTGGSGRCAHCGSPKLKVVDTINGGAFPTTVYKCRKCGGLKAYDQKPASHYGDKEDMKSHVGDPYKGLTRLAKSIPPQLRRKLPGPKKVRIGL